MQALPAAEKIVTIDETANHGAGKILFAFSECHASGAGVTPLL